MNALARHHRRSFAILIGLLIQAIAFGQLKAGFSTNLNSGCAPLLINFTDLSTGTPTQWKWDLGNGVISSLKDPSATYFNPGTYTIKLTVKNASGSDSLVKEQLITVFPNPVIRFTVSDSSGCIPFPVQFENRSTTIKGVIENWSWDFGDGTTSALEQPNHIYSHSGKYNVTLKAVNSYGCSASAAKIAYIQAFDGVKASFVHSESNPCQVPAAIAFTNTSSGPAGLSFQWDFGDGTTSVQAEPVHVYNKKGNYSVKLIVNSPQGCSDTLIMENEIAIGSTHTEIEVPSVICENKQFQVGDKAAINPSSVLWDFGDGSFSTDLKPFKSYAKAGDYSIKIVNNFNGCLDSTILMVHVLKLPKPAFTVVSAASCKAPFSVSFKNESTDGKTYLWNFGDGGLSSEVNPVHIYKDTGRFDVTLIAFNENGCSDTVVKYGLISVQKPEILVKNLPAGGCVPVSISPVAIIQSNQPVLNYLWRFGDGSTSTAMEPVHSYSKAGTYTVTLVVTLSNGCMDSLVMPSAVRVGNKPHADFKVVPDDVCASMPAHFQDLSTGSPDQWLWDFGDKLTAASQNPAHVFDGLGKFTVSLIVWSNACADTITKVDVVNVRPPIAGFQVIHSCTDRYKKGFLDRSIGATSVSWDFGDGTTSAESNPEHRFKAPGIYRVTLNVTNGTCTNLNWAWVKVLDEKASFDVSKPNPCKREVVVFRAKDINTRNIANWTWNFGDGTTSHNQDSTSHFYRESGIYQVSLEITDSLGCQSDQRMTVTVNGPKASFLPGQLAACLKGNSIPFNENSTDDGSHKIIKRSWYFGDGSSTSNLSAPYLHTYNDAGVYLVSLRVEDESGCTDSIAAAQAIIIAQPTASFISPDTNSCTGKPVHLINQSDGLDLSYQWDFGDRSSGTDQNPIHTYAGVGNYTIQLQVTDKFGCTDHMERSGYVQISFPVARFKVSDSIGTCPPLLVHFTNESTGYDQFIWDFGDGNTSTLKSPSHYYTVAGEYEARLIITGPGGCTDVARKKIVIKGPSGNFSYTPLKGCAPLPVAFTATTKNTASFIWDMGDGTTIPGSSLNTAHVYKGSGNYVPKLIIVDDGGCTVPVTGNDTIHVFDVTASFVVSSEKRCDPGSIQFSNRSVSNDYITAYQWDFGDGTYAAEMDPSHYYERLGNYSVQLKTITANGCVSTFRMNDSLQVLEKPVISIEGSKEACVPASINFSGGITKGASAGESWQWDFDNGEYSDKEEPLAIAYKKEGDYTVKAYFTAANGCRDTAAHLLVIHPLPATNAGSDEAICRGSLTTLHASGAATYSWKENATLSCTECPAPLAAPLLQTTYFVKGYSAYGCSSEDSVTVSVHQPFTLQIGAGDTICAGEKVVLQASGADLYSWTPSMGVQDPLKGTTAATPATSTHYTVIAKDQFNCFSDSGSVSIKVWPIPTVEAGADITLPVGESMQLKPVYSTDIVSYKWNQAPTMSCATCPEPVIRPKQTTTYGIQVRNEGGCIAKDEVRVFVICNNGNLFIPNTFSPNRDGNNDLFYPSGKGINRIRSLRVFNRWGEVVFERNDFSPNDPLLGWDGKYKGIELAPDVYVYTCDVICQNNEILTFKGDVSLLR